jgi:hypothetical protein
MTCDDVRAVLPLLIYGEAIAEEAALREHLGHCAACRREQLAFAEVRHRLGALSVPPIAVDLDRLHEARSAQQADSLRRWRRIAAAMGGIAALLLLALGLRLEIRLQANQVVLRWGEPSSGGTGVPPVASSGGTGVPPVLTRDRRDAGPTLPPETEAELRILSDLIHALKQDVEDRDRQTAERLDRLQGHLRSLQAQADLRWNENKQDVAALYLLSHKGDKP